MRRAWLVVPALAGLLMLAPTGQARRPRKPPPPPPSQPGISTINWSGYTWDVRPAGVGGPGPNQWSNSPDAISVDSSGNLVLTIKQNLAGQWSSVEIDNQRHLGYGTYRWVVASDLSSSALDPNEVLGMFTYGGSSPSNNEIDIEASHWGDPSFPTGSATVWQNANTNKSIEKTFAYSAKPPYVNQFTWAPGKITYLVTDSSGATLLSWVVTQGVPTPSTEVPVINYWRFNGVAPKAVKSIRLASFSFTP